MVLKKDLTEAFLDFKQETIKNVPLIYAMSKQSPFLKADSLVHPSTEDLCEKYMFRQLANSSMPVEL